MGQASALLRPIQYGWFVFNHVSSVVGRHLVGKLKLAPVKVEALVELSQVVLKKIEVVSPFQFP